MFIRVGNGIQKVAVVCHSMDGSCVCVCQGGREGEMGREGGRAERKRVDLDAFGSFSSDSFCKLSCTWLCSCFANRA